MFTGSNDLRSFRKSLTMPTLSVCAVVRSVRIVKSSGSELSVRRPHTSAR